MLVSYNWLHELLPDLALTPKELAEALTMGLFETEIASKIAIDPATIVVRITKLEAHPNADRLRLAVIDTGSGEETIVCGAPNIKEGQLVPYSPPGATVRDEDGSDFKLKTVAIRGVESPGMLNSPRELGLGNWHGGIYVLPEDTPVGSQLKEHIPDDTVLEVELTPNRAHDCFSHRGLARELGALLNLEVNEPEIPASEYSQLSDWKLEVAAGNHDTRAYYGTVLEGAAVRPSPMWLQARLWAVGARPINNVVDVTNLVMYEMGGPTHAFDADKLPGMNINSRRAKNGEQVVTLDGQAHQLTEESLVITSDDEPVALAGVMGGQATEVGEGTSNLFLEVANFYPYTVYRSSLRHALTTDGSQRWVKDVPIAFTQEASNRTIALLAELAGATVVGQIVQPAVSEGGGAIEFDPERPSRIAGVSVTHAQVEDALLRQRCTVDAAGDLWQVTPPADRIDLQGEHDLVEDVLRIVGYNTIETAVQSREVLGELPPQVKWRETVRDLLSSEGFSEMQNESFEDARILELLHPFFSNPAGQLEVANPAAPEKKYLRQVLLPRLLGCVLDNRSEISRPGAGERAFFEFGSVFSAGEGKVVGVAESEQLAMVVVGDQTMLNDTIERMLTALGVQEKVDLRVEENADYEIEGVSVGSAGELSPQTTLATKMRTKLWWAQFDFDALVAIATGTSDFTPQAPARIQFEPFSKYPAVTRDVSLVVSGGVSVEQIQEVIEREGGELVADVDLFDEYSADNGQKSYGFRVAYQADDRTLTGDEVAKMHNGIVQRLREEFDIAVR